MQRNGTLRHEEKAMLILKSIFKKISGIHNLLASEQVSAFYYSCHEITRFKFETQKEIFS